MKLIFVIFSLLYTISYADIKLSLEEALTHTIKHDFNLKLSKIDTNINKNRIIKEHSKFQPNLSASTVSSKDRNHLTNDVTTKKYSTNLKNKFATGTTATLSYTHDSTRNLESNNRFNSAMNIKLEQELLKGFGQNYNLTAVNIANKQLAISNQMQKKQLIQTIYSLQFAYWSYLKAYEDVRIRHQSLALSQQLLEQKRKEVALGGYAKINLLEIEADVLSKSRQIALTEQTYQRAKIELLRVMNAPNEWYVQEIIPTNEPKIKELVCTEDNLIQKALQSRQDYIRNRLNLDINELLKNYNNVRKLPSLTLSTTLTNNTPSTIKSEYNTLDTFSRKGWQVALDFSYELFNNSAKSEYEIASLNLQKAKTQLAQLTNDIHAQVLDAKRVVDYSKKIAELTLLEYEQQKKVLEAEKLKLQSGMSNIRDYLYNQNALILSELNLIGNKVEFLKAEASLYKTVGIIPPKLQPLIGDEIAK